MNLKFENGVYGLLAPNGAEKTTLIKMLTTLIFPNEGEILYKGHDIVKMDEEYHHILGYLPQEFGYYKNYSPKKFLLYLAALKGIDRETSKKRVKELLKLVGLEDVEDKKMKIRFISEDKSESNWISVYPNLEDIFLYVYRDENLEME